MKDLKTVIGFTMKEMVKRKSFIISTIIILILIVIGFNVPNIIKAFKGNSSEAEKDKLLIVDTENIFEGTLNSLNNMELGYEANTTNENISFEKIKEKIENKEIDEAIIIEKNQENYKIRYIIEDATMVQKIPTTLENAISSIYSNLQISKLGLTEEQVKSITPNFEFSIEQTEEQKVSGNVFAMMLMSLVLFYAIYFCAYQVSSSITTEKTSKIMETLVTSTSPRTIVLGKTIGIGIVGLVQVCLIVGTAIISAKMCLDENLVNSVLDVSKITPYLGIVTIIYFILGYFAYALLYALTGSTVSKPEDIQSANTPVALIAVIGFYLSYFTMMNPTSDLNVLASMLPISSPFCMPFRIMMGLANATDVLISIAILLITILIVAKVAIKIYSNAILNYGTKMSFKDMVKIYKDKNN
ncbi:MAG: ABC transporter permease [Clostridia bacterium]